MNFRNLAVAIYAVGFFLWFLAWHLMVGYGWLKRERMMYLPFVGGALTILVNAVLAYFAQVPEYDVEIGIYGYVENNAKTIATFTLGIAVFVVVTFGKSASMLEREESMKFLQLIFSSFLLSVVGVLPLYWVPQVFGWLTILRHLKTIPYLYSLFVFAAAMVIYLHELKRGKNRSRENQGNVED